MKKSTTIFVFILALFFYTGSLHAFNGILSDFNSRYPGSSSGANASCQLCHGQSTSTWNEYGWNLRQNNLNFSAIEGLPSINNSGETTFLDEINASTQPGWTTGGNNNIYDSGGFTTDTATAPSGIVGALDPAVASQPPMADAGGDSNGFYFGTVESPVTFDGSGSSAAGNIVSYNWDFGDGATGTGVSPSHTYAAAGTYTVSLTVTDDVGETDTATAIAEIGSAPNVPPTADPNGPYTGTAGIVVSFDGSGSSDSDGSIVSYDWDFGDGATGTGVSPNHTYATGGTYIVWLTVTDDGGATGTDTTTATIQDIITGQPSPPSQPDGDITAPEPMEEVEVKVLNTIKRKNRAVTAVKIELVEDDMRIADTLCGPEGAQLVAPKRLVRKKDGETIAIFRTNDLGIQYDGTQLVCTGTMEPDGTKFMGASNQLTSGGDVNDESNEHVKDRRNNDEHQRDDD
jgi:PKD repeat protein